MFKRMYEMSMLGIDEKVYTKVHPTKAQMEEFMDNHFPKRVRRIFDSYGNVIDTKPVVMRIDSVYVFDPDSEEEDI